MTDTAPRIIRHNVAVETDEDQAYFWTEEWQAGEREASQEIADGAGETFASGEEFLHALDPERAERDAG